MAQFPIKDGVAVIPEGTKIIPNKAFSGCTSLVSVTIPNGVTEIGWRAFDNCTSLRNVIIPNSVTNIHTAAFWGCTSLETIALPNGTTSNLESGWGGLLNHCTSLREVTFLEGVKRIDGDGLFDGCTNLTTINLPFGIEYIDFCAFCACPSISTINVPFATVDYYKRRMCKSLHPLIVAPTSEEYNGVATFYNQVKTPFKIEGGIAIIPEEVTVIEYKAFSRSANLLRVVIPEGVEEIDYEAFADCNNLLSISFPASLKYIAHNVLTRCYQLEEITFNGRVEFVGNNSVLSGINECGKLRAIHVAREDVEYYKEHLIEFDRDLVIGG